MLSALNTASTGMAAQQKQIESVSNNLANADTTGFKKTRAEFQDLLYHTEKAPGAATSATTQNPTGVQIGVGSKVVGVSRDLEQGSLKPTGRPLDVAIEGEGFLAFQKPNGELAYSRDGSLRVSSEGQLVNADGFPLVPEITVPQGSKGVTISFDGRIVAMDSQNQTQEVGQLQLTSFANPGGLSALGGNMFAATTASGAPVPGTPTDGGLGSIHQSYLEGSNVNPVSEMTDMIRAQRIFEMNSKVVSTADQMLNAVNQIR